ncbi:MAG: acyltransferase [Lachnospiraceae bacterium]|jgi:peptidoglycan/LPS O-acetylase OafA/YrhL|nr:acyltransferase [Lachnospiraceae bacterium]
MDKHLANYSNCLNLIRIIAAFQVMFGHLVEHMELPINDTFFRLTYFLRGVPIFFVISGFLMWFSIGKSKSYGQYLRKRFWRIYPELWGSVFVELITLVILYRGWDLKSLAFFAFGQGTIFQFWTPESLRGYGVGVPNGALWTMGVMIQFYIVVWFFYKVMKNCKLRTWIIGFIVIFFISFGLDDVTHEIAGREIIGKLYDQTAIRYFWLFYIGMFVAEHKDCFLPLLQRFWYICLIIAGLFFWTGFDLFSGYYLGWSLFLAVGLIGFAYRFPQFSISPDISYGLFLYHMIVVNVFVNFGWIGNWLYVIPILIIAVGLAYASTITIGGISLTKKQKIEAT